MKAYGIARVGEIAPHPEIGEYLRRIDETLAPFEGRFLVHASPFQVVEGDWPAGGVIIIEFPDSEAARAWYASDAYQAILPFRTRHIQMDVILAEGVPEPYSAAETADKLGF
ncbi:DUF1330 domain-containing protein [Actinocorallia longicatena]|uniref:DUF1330 domain-containing protein n=1 Tax=Actinocorallia longicatena TaxID=111803 RepID=A0ABP6QBP2_9ACTN